MKEVRGDLIALAKAVEFDVIVHGANCYQKMGTGIALQVKKSFPGAYQADLMRAGSPESRLGSISYAECSNDQGGLVYVVNAYTQLRYGYEKCHADLNAIWSAMSAVKSEFSGMRIGYPMIGAGKAGGDWREISPVIDDALTGEDHTLVVWS